ncbi:MAG: hypothetical protein ACE1ZC_03720 [Nitrososphaerales archaeon]|nr:hypothetical protein [Nitrososphaerota archaeon]
MVQNWLNPYNYIFAGSFIVMGLLIPLRGLPEAVAIMFRLTLIFLGAYLLVGTFRRAKGRP